MHLFGYGANDLQFLCGVEKTFVASGNVVVHFNAEDMIFGRLAYDLIRIVAVQTVRADAYVVGPILFGLLRRSNWSTGR